MAASPAQVRFISNLAREAGADEAKIAAADFSQLTNTDIDTLINQLKADIATGAHKGGPKANGNQRGGQRTQRVEPPEGYHRLNGQIYSVKAAIHGSGNLVGRRLCIERADDLKAELEAYRTAKENGTATGQAPKLGWDYIGRQGAFWDLSADTLMTHEEAAGLGKLYSFCVRCGIGLVEPVSIERGMGPICFGKDF